MKMRCLLSAVAVFAAGIYTGLAMASSVARSAGCPAATKATETSGLGGSPVRTCKEGRERRTKEQMRTAARDLMDTERAANLESLEKLFKRRSAPEPPPAGGPA